MHLPELQPGEHIAIISDTERASIDARVEGLQLRDTILLLRYGPRVDFVFLFRKPLKTSSILEQVLTTGAGSFHLDAARTEKGRWPSNLVLLHGPTCEKNVCDPRCPVHWLNRQGGETTSSSDPHRFQGTVKFKNRVYVKEGDVAAATITNDRATAYGDQGGVSRYYPNFYSEDELFAWLDRLLA